MADEEFEIDIPEQGISKRLPKDGVLKFIDQEIAFCTRIASVMNENLEFGQWGLGGQAAAVNTIRNHCQRVRETIADNHQHELRNFIGTARSLRIVVGQGKIGQHIEWLIQNGRKLQAQWIFLLFNEGQENSWVAPFRAIALGNPAMLAFCDLGAAQTALNQAETALVQTETSQEKLSEFIADKTKLINDLEELYRKKLVIDEPANSWQKVARVKRAAWQIWLLIFSALVVGPIGVVIYFWDSFANAISHLTTTGTTISFAGVAAVSLPALLYAWLLKNVSGVFIQTLNLADDAAHRRALAVTYLGLAENPKIKLLEAERAIVLNALFRPIPTQAGDEGPPAGLVDLIRGKGT